MHTLFLGWNVGKAAMFSALALVDKLAPFAQPFAFATVLYVLARTSLVLPAAAVGEAALAPLSWARSENNGWRLVLLRAATWVTVVLALSPVLVPGFVFAERQFRVTHHASAIQCLPLALAGFLIIPVGSSTVALAYRGLRDYRPGRNADGA